MRRGKIHRDKAKEMMTIVGDKALQSKYMVKFVDFLENRQQAFHRCFFVLLLIERVTGTGSLTTYFIITNKCYLHISTYIIQKKKSKLLQKKY